MHHHTQTIADIEREQAPGLWSILGGAFLFLAFVLAMAFILSI